MRSPTPAVPARSCPLSSLSPPDSRLPPPKARPLASPVRPRLFQPRERAFILLNRYVPRWISRQCAFRRVSPRIRSCCAAVRLVIRSLSEQPAQLGDNLVVSRVVL